MNSKKYVEILKNCKSDIYNLHPNGILLLWDNDSKHKSEMSLDYYIENKIQLLEWPAYTVFDVVQSPLCLVPLPCKYGKILVVDHFVEKNYIENFRIRSYFKKDFLNFSFHYVRYCNHLVTFLEKISHHFTLFKLSMKLARAISSSSSSVKSDHLESIEFSSL